MATRRKKDDFLATEEVKMGFAGKTRWGNRGQSGMASFLGKRPSALARESNGSIPSIRTYHPLKMCSLVGRECVGNVSYVRESDA